MASNTSDSDLNDILKNQLECPICFVTCTSPIFLCANGHNVCGDCQKSLKACPVCRKDGKPSIRNLFAEQVSMNLITSCQNTGQGCKVSLKVLEMADHLKACEFGYKCMFQNCDWRGLVVALGGHVKKSHPSCYLEVSETGTRICIDGDEYEEEEDLFLTTMLSYNDRLFWFHIEITDLSSLDAVIRLVGPDDQKAASKFSYKLEFCSEDGRKRVSYDNRVLPLIEVRDEPADSVFDDAFALSSFFTACHLIFTVSLFTDKEVSKPGTGLPRGSDMEVLFCPPQKWPALDYRERSVRREKNRDSGW